MRMLKEGRYPDDRGVLIQSLIRTVSHQLYHLKVQVRGDEEIKAVFKMSVELLKELSDPTQRLALAESISKKLPVLADFKNSSIFKNVPYQLGQVIARADQTRLTSTAAQHLAATQTALNQHMQVHGAA
ncbi:MAG: hypothetical protein GAK37_00568 [Pseudomonas sp.]|nr:MAG: hypothetical protein GAK37_00568 [Pseudomonas sp.]